MQGGVDHDGLALLELHLHLHEKRTFIPRGCYIWAGYLLTLVIYNYYWCRAWEERRPGLPRQARACTVAPKPGAFPPSPPPLLPIPAASRLSSLSKRWPCEVEAGEWPRLVAEVSELKVTK